ncbi:hypothetical protein CVT25_000134 [Psilocybe cyanescens]|uniref:Uncharacterized protein n=1 Tax=Psilocybe cyanescens TaxID=93625 RepID=A0A409WZ21_PSICY|nr:hypothetical protein CVT25_000134 [Psilocybe cyanescens]
MSLQHLLYSLPEPPSKLCDIYTLDALCEELDLKFKAFIASESTNILYSSYLLQYLNTFRAWLERCGSMLFYDGETLDLAVRRIIHYLAKNDMFSITPLVFYASYETLSIGEINHLPEVNLSSEIQHCGLSVEWWPSSLGHAEIETLYKLESHILEGEDEELRSQWIRLSMRLMCLCLTLLGNDTIKRARNPNA